MTVVLSCPRMRVTKPANHGCPIKSGMTAFVSLPIKSGMTAFVSLPIKSGMTAFVSLPIKSGMTAFVSLPIKSGMTAFVSLPIKSGMTVVLSYPRTRVSMHSKPGCPIKSGVTTRDVVHENCSIHPQWSSG
ncbi:hypothetical protein [Limnohabitans parvus]|uniref:hypothetical protein n=1 Tax=Limnohabitans parvus TaxID=540061 RepID=UPI0011B1EC3C|nr:hypothetical protein [Limnohabitans parvus]